MPGKRLDEQADRSDLQPQPLIRGRGPPSVQDRARRNPCPGEAGTAPAGPAQPGAGQVGADQRGAVQARAGEVGAGEVGAVQAGPGEPGAGEVRPGQAGAGQPGVGQVGIAEVGPGQVVVRGEDLAAQVLADEVGQPHVRGQAMRLKLAQQRPRVPLAPVAHGLRQSLTG